jgi:hypothetical protein
MTIAVVSDEILSYRRNSVIVVESVVSMGSSAHQVHELLSCVYPRGEGCRFESYTTHWVLVGLRKIKATLVTYLAWPSTLIFIK